MNVCDSFNNIVNFKTFDVEFLDIFFFFLLFFLSELSLEIYLTTFTIKLLVFFFFCFTKNFENFERDLKKISGTEFQTIRLSNKFRLLELSRVK